MSDAAGAKPVYRRIPWRKILGEGVLIVVSVFIAIVLEGVFQERGRKQDALAALAQVLDELGEDRADLAEIVAEQELLDHRYRDVLRWLATPATMPRDSVGAALDRLGRSNRTLYPRRGAWTALIATHATSIEDRRLLTRLGNFFESRRDRIEDNGSAYDFNLNDVMRRTVPAVWDPVRDRLLTRDARAISELRGQLRFLHTGWNLYYLDLLREYRTEIDALIADIGSYLSARGVPTGAV